MNGTANTVQTTTNSGSVNTVISNESASSATSGDGEGLGLRSQVVATSNQYVGISAPGASSAEGQQLRPPINVDTAGYSQINTGAAMTQPTPTPIPPYVPDRPRRNPPPHGRRRALCSLVVPYGFFNVNPWDDFATQGFRFDMPGQHLRLMRADGTYYEVDPWGADRRRVQGLGIPDGGAPVQLKPSGDEDARHAQWLPINARGTLPSMPDMAGRGGPPPGRRRRP